MPDRPIGFFDSGVGGLTVLYSAVKQMPEENFIYFGDSQNAPYGTKNADKVFELTSSAVEKLVLQGAKAVVIACNTATSIAVDRLRETVAVPIISMEPAVKPALEQTSGNVLLLATSVTLSSKRVCALIDKLDVDNRVIKVPCPDLAAKIEASVFGKEDVLPYLESVLAEYKDVGATAVVLGCTHYPLVKDKIKACLGENVLVFDGIDGTVQHLKDVLIQNNVKRNEKQKGTVLISSSKDDKKTNELFDKLISGGIL